MIIFNGDKVKKTYRKDINALRKMAKNVKAKKGRTIKMYAMNIERKKLLKQRREKVLQNAKDRKSAKENLLTAVKASHKADGASKDTQSGRKPNDELINGANADTITPVDDIDNIQIVAENVVNVATNAENTDINSTNAGNIVNAEIENDNSEYAVMTDDNSDDTAMSDNYTSDTMLGNDNAKNVAPGEISTMMYPHLYFMVEKQQIQVKPKLPKSIDLLGSSPLNLQ